MKIKISRATSMVASMLLVVSCSSPSGPLSNSAGTSNQRSTQASGGATLAIVGDQPSSAVHSDDSFAVSKDDDARGDADDAGAGRKRDHGTRKVCHAKPKVDKDHHADKDDKDDDKDHRAEKDDKDDDKDHRADNDDKDHRVRRIQQISFAGGSATSAGGSSGGGSSSQGGFVGGDFSSAGGTSSSQSGSASSGSGTPAVTPSDKDGDDCDDSKDLASLGKPDSDDRDLCGRESGVDGIRMHVAGNHKTESVPASDALIAKVTGNHAHLTLQAKSGDSIGAICLFVSGNDAVVNIDISSTVEHLFVIARGHNSQTKVNVHEGGVLKSVSSDLGGHKPTLEISGSGSHACGNPRLHGDDPTFHCTEK